MCACVALCHVLPPASTTVISHMAPLAFSVSRYRPAASPCTCTPPSSHCRWEKQSCSTLSWGVNCIQGQTGENEDGK